MTTNYKGLLQEYCQKRNTPCPSYQITQKTAANSSLPTFRCIVTSAFGRYKSDGLCLTKKSAEQSAAKNACEYLYITTKGTVSDVTPRDTASDNVLSETMHNFDVATNCAAKPCVTQGNTLVLIDLENCPKFGISEFLHTEFVNVSFVSFYGKCSSQAKNEEKVQQSLPFSKFVKVNFARDDGVDHFISVYAGVLLAENRYQNIIIVSSDKFAASAMDSLMQLRDVIPNSVLTSAKHVSTAIECYETLMEFVE